MQNLLIFLFILLTSCAIERPDGTTEAEVLFKEANELLSDSRYILATEKLNTLRSQYPYSYYATSAELLQADILFMQENYEEASAAYILFKDFHPKNQKLDYVIWKIAESYYKQVPPTFDRDLQPAVKAISYYNELRSLYPNSEYLKDASEKIQKCNELLLNKEKYIADFYYKTEDFSSAKFRYKKIVTEINDKDLRSHSLIRLLKIGLQTEDQALCKEIYPKYTNSILDADKKDAQNIYFKCMQ